MPDDRDEPRKAPSTGDETRAGDATQEFDPFAEDDAEDERSAAPTAPGTTAPLPASDQTAPMPRADETAPLAAAPDETKPIPVADETRAGQAGDADRTAPLAGGAGVWSGRAGVPPPRSTTIRGSVPQDWEPAPDGDERRWWMPIVVGFVAVLLLGTLVVGIWLIMRANDDATPAGATPSQTAAPPTTAAPTTAAAPTTSAPAPTTTAPASVEVPRLVGLTEAEARERLGEEGLSYRVEFRESEEAPGTVIETDPAQGMSVPEGTQIVLVIARPAPTTAPPTSPSTPATSPATP